MKFLWTFLVLIGWTHAMTESEFFVAALEGNNERVWVGDIAEKYPFMVSVVAVAKDGGISHLCGASLIDKDNLLTAAHCSLYWEGWKQRNYSVEAWIGGQNFKNFNGQKIKIANSTEFHKGDWNKYDQDDISVARLSRSVEITQRGRRRPNIDTVTPICIGLANYKDGRPINLIGFGKSKCDDNNLDGQLRIASGKIYDDCGSDDGKKICAQVYNKQGQLSGGMTGDSGSPFFIYQGQTPVQLGVMTSSYECNGCPCGGEGMRNCRGFKPIFYRQFISTYAPAARYCSI